MEQIWYKHFILHFNCQGYESIVYSLLEHKANVYAACTADTGDTLLYIAAYNGRQYILISNFIVHVH